MSKKLVHEMRLSQTQGRCFTLIVWPGKWADFAHHATLSPDPLTLKTVEDTAFTATTSLASLASHDSSPQQARKWIHLLTSSSSPTQSDCFFRGPISFVTSVRTPTRATSSGHARSGALPSTQLMVIPHLETSSSCSTTHAALHGPRVG